MADARDFLLTDIRIGDGPPEHVAIRSGRLYRHAGRDQGLPVVEGQGGRLIAGLVDHHLHLMAEAMRGQSVDLSDLPPDVPSALAERLRSAAIEGPIRATGLDDGGAALLDKAALDTLVADRPLRIQYRTGGLWVLNSAELDRVLAGRADPPDAFERDAGGGFTGRVWRGDAWLRRMGPPPSLAAIGRQLNRWGVTAVTDASITTDQAQAEAIAQAAERDGIAQHLTLMSGGPLQGGAGWAVGPMKILLDEAALPDLDTLTATIERAHGSGRAVAAHVVTPAELALMLAAWQIAGAAPGDRIEHGSLIPADMLEGIAALGLVVVTNPGFLNARGDRYLRSLPTGERDDLYRLRSLLDAGITVAAGSDAPYGPLNPWVSIRAAATRRTAGGKLIGAGEALSRRQAVTLHGSDRRHAGRAVVLEDGAAADLALLRPDGEEGEEPVAMTIIAGKIVYRAPAGALAPEAGPETGGER